MLEKSIEGGIIIWFIGVMLCMDYDFEIDVMI